MTLAQTAQVLGVNVVTVRRMIHAGRLEAYTLDPHAQRPVYRVTPAAVQALRERGRVVARGQEVKA